MDRSQRRERIREKRAKLKRTLVSRPRENTRPTIQGARHLYFARWNVFQIERELVDLRLELELDRQRRILQRYGEEWKRGPHVSPRTTRVLDAIGGRIHALERKKERVIQNQVMELSRLEIAKNNPDMLESDIALAKQLGSAVERTTAQYRLLIEIQKRNRQYRTPTKGEELRCYRLAHSIGSLTAQFYRRALIAQKMYGVTIINLRTSQVKENITKAVNLMRDTEKLIRMVEESD